MSETPPGGYQPQQSPSHQPQPSWSPASSAYGPSSSQATGSQPTGGDQPTTVYGPPWRSDSGAPPPRRKRGTAALVTLALAAGLVGGGIGAGATYALDQDDSQPASSTSGQSSERASANTSSVTVSPSDVQEIADQVSPSVVSISVATSAGTGEGSGVILSVDGLILTNNHVVAGAEQGGQLLLTFHDDSTAEATVVGVDPVTDIAVIQAEGASGLTPATLGSSGDVAVGQDVIAFGSPLGLSGTVTTGIVSSVDRPVRTGQAELGGETSSTVIDAIQTDAAINPGNSGGALVDAAGQVIGVNTAIASLGGGMTGPAGSIGLGFAIPIDQAKWVADQLIEDGTAEHALLGVSVADAGSQDGLATGAGIAEVNSGSAAEQAGLQSGDVVTKLGDRATKDADHLIAAVRSHRPGDEVEVTYVRDGEEQTTTVTLDSDGGETQVPQQPEQQEQDEPQSPWDFLPRGR